MFVPNGLGKALGLMPMRHCWDRFLFRVARKAENLINLLVRGGNIVTTYICWQRKSGNKYVSPGIRPKRFLTQGPLMAPSRPGRVRRHVRSW